MIFNLSKDKSLAGMLKRVELDGETKELVNQGASATLIKMSLVKNMNSSNVVQYRRYIQKAEEEETEEERKERLEAEREAAREARSRGTEEQEREEGARLADVEEAVSGKDRGSSVSEIAEQEERRLAELRGDKKVLQAEDKQKKLTLSAKYKKNKEAKKKIEQIQGFSAALKKITDNLDMKSGKSIRTREFEQFVGPNKERGIKIANELISLVSELEKDKEALIKYLNSFDGGFSVLRTFDVYEGKNEKGETKLKEKLKSQFVPMLKKKGTYEYTTDKNSIIDIPALQNELLSYIKEYPNEGGKPLSLSEVLGEMFSLKFKRKAARFIDKNQQKTVMDALMGYSKGKDIKLELGFKKATKNINKIKAFIRSFKNIERNLKERLEDLNEMKEDTSILLERKQKEIINSFKLYLKVKPSSGKNSDTRLNELTEESGENRSSLSEKGKILRRRLEEKTQEIFRLSFGDDYVKYASSILDSQEPITKESFKQNLEAAISEMKDDIDDEIQLAEAKVNEVIKSLNQLGYGDTETEFSIKDLIQDYGSLIKRLTDEEGELIPLGKTSINILIKGNNDLSQLTRLSKNLVEEFMGYEEGLSEAMQNIMEDGITIEESFSIDDRFEELGFTEVAKFNELRDKYIALKDKLQETVNEAGEEFAQLDRGSEKPKPPPRGRGYETKEEKQERFGSGRFKLKPSKRQPEGDEE